MAKYGFVYVPAWEYDIVCEEGLINEGGTCIFVDKSEAEKMGMKHGQFHMPDKVKDVYFDGEKKEIPFLSIYTTFYVMSIDVEALEKELNTALELLEEEDIPPLWFTKERIPPLCIIHTEQIPI